MKITVVARPVTPERNPVALAVNKTLTSGKAVRITTNGTKRRRRLQTILYRLTRRRHNIRLRTMADGPDSLIAWLEKK